MNHINGCGGKPFSMLCNGPIEIEQIEGVNRFLAFPEYLKKSGCSNKVLPYSHEFELLVQKYKSESNGLGILTFTQGQFVTGFVTYLKRNSVVNIRLGEKHLFGLTFPALQILRPNSNQWRDNPEVLRSSFAFLSREEPNRAIRVTEIHSDSVLWEFFLKLGKKHYLVANERAIEHRFHLFDTDFDSFLKKLKHKPRTNIRRKIKIIKKKFGTKLSLKEYGDPESVERFLNAANRISKKTYQAKLFGEIVDNTHESKSLLSFHAKCGYFRSFILWVDQFPISFLLGFQTPDGIYEHAITGYDPDWKQHSPGFCCNFLALKRLYESNKPKSIDFGQGDNELKRLMGNKKIRSISPIFFPKNSFGKLIYSTYSYSELLNRLLVNNLERMGLRTKLKNYFRRQ